MTTEETPHSNLAPTRDDAQRAAALIVHFSRRDVEGCNEIIRQVTTCDDPSAATTRLLFAVTEVYQELVPVLHTERGLQLLTAVIVDLANVDEKEAS